MSDDISISIVTACYNSAKFISRTHRSLQLQTHKNFEWICVDDCSTDDTVERLVNFAPPGHLGMKVYRLPANSGGGVPVGLGTLHATGDLTIWLDHDDELLPYALEEVARNWARFRNDPSLGGLAFMAMFSDGSTVGARKQVHEAPMSWNESTNIMPSVCDVTFSFRTAILKKYATLEYTEGMALSGSLYGELTRKYPYIMPDAPPIRYYHRDNPVSQTNLLRISRKTVISYARIIDNADWFFLIRPWQWLKHIAIMLYFSRIVFGRWFGCLSFIGRPAIRLLVIASLPLGIVASIRSRSVRIVDYPAMDLASLTDLRDEYASHAADDSDWPSG